MAGNTFGQIFKLTTFGESHGKCIGGIIDGCPPCLQIDMDFIQNQLNKRKPKKEIYSTSRNEEDKIIFLSGIVNGLTIGTPITFMIENKDNQSKDYDSIKDIYRPSHADYTYEMKYGIREHNGGGRASARETIARVVGGAIAQLILNQENIEIYTFVSQIGNIKVEYDLKKINKESLYKNNLNCPDELASSKINSYLEEIKEKGDTLGGKICCIVKNAPVGLGEPVFDKLEADLAKAVLSIPACKGFEIGSGFDCVEMKGSEHNDIFEMQDNRVVTKTNFSGGIQGGISNGQDIYFIAAFKPVSTIKIQQDTINKQLEKISYLPEGRHDVCVVPRACVIVESMTALVLVDHLLRNKTIQ